MVSKLSSILRLIEGVHSHKLIKPDTGLPLTLNALAQHIVEKKLIYFGETHGQPRVLELELLVLKILVEQVKLKGKGYVKVFMEHFNFEQQDIIDKFMRGDINEQELYERYKSTGNEGHDIQKYEDFFLFARENSENVQLKSGFLPRKFAKLLVKEGEEEAYSQVRNLGYISDEDRISGTENHYNFFESLISGRDLQTDFDNIGDRFRKIFPAQVLKDNAMAAVLRKNLESSTSDDKFLVVAGSGHIDYRLGVPERVDKYNVIPKHETLIITVRSNEQCKFKENTEFGKVEQFDAQFPGDVVLLYEENNDDKLKAEIKEAYEKVASTAHMQGNIRLANKVMSRLGYTEHQIQVAGADAYNYQGVGCPHTHADIRPGEQVLDIGSGLGVDSFIAADCTGQTGFVTGIDISKGEVLHANTRAEARGSNNTKFIQADMEDMPFKDETFDVIISNGAFCLAPDKEKAFKEIYRVLKPGGRFSVCCTTLLTNLEKAVNWPICMRVFMPLENAQPMLSNIGFKDILVDDSDSKMDLEITVDEETGPSSEAVSGGRKGVHVGSEEFRHLENYDMNKLCARVVLVGTKPL